MDAMSTDTPSIDGLPETPSTTTEKIHDKHHYGWKFYAIFACLIATTLLSALDGSIVATALPTIASTLHSGPDYIWISNVYFLTGAIVQPLFGQLSDLWGRRWVFITVVAIFTLGSGLCGGATSTNMLIAARAVQGVGAGGINMMVDLVICDMVPMRDRGKFLGIIFAIIGVFSAVGPLIGGALVQHGAWRWAFYLNVPVGGIAITISFMYLHLGKRAGGTLRQRLGSIDWGGLTILTISTIAVMYATTYGGSLRSWTDPTVLGPLIAGLALLLVFGVFERTKLAPNPVIPHRLFTNRTSAAAFVLTFCHSILGLWTTYVFSVYFQAVLLVSPTKAGVYLIPTAIAFPLAAAVGGGIITKTSKYKAIHLVGFALVTVGCGLATTLGPNANAAAWIFYQLFMAIGLGAITACLLPAVQAELAESDTASSTATWAFIRSYGVIWGVTIPAAIFNNRFDQLVHTIPDSHAREILGHGQAYAHATAELVQSFEGETMHHVHHVYSQCIQRVWQISIVFMGFSFLVSLLEKQVALRTTLDTDFGLQEEKTKEAKTHV